MILPSSKDFQSYSVRDLAISFVLSSAWWLLIVLSMTSTYWNNISDIVQATTVHATTITCLGGLSLEQRKMVYKTGFKYPKLDCCVNDIYVTVLQAVRK